MAYVVLRGVWRRVNSNISDTQDENFNTPSRNFPAEEETCEGGKSGESKTGDDVIAGSLSQKLQEIKPDKLTVSCKRILVSWQREMRERKPGRAFCCICMSKNFRCYLL